MFNVLMCAGFDGASLLTATSSRIVSFMLRDPIDIEAMLIRHRAAMAVIGDGDMEGIDLLAQVLAPDPGLRAASLQAARESGPSYRALELSRKKPKREHDAAKPPPEHRARSGSSVTLDDLLSTLS